MKDVDKKQAARARRPLICSADAPSGDAERETPESRAIRVVREWIDSEPRANANLMIAISTQIREAVEVERQRCAEIAETEFADDGWHPAAKNAAIAISSSIRGNV